VILGAMLLGVATLAGRWRVAPRSGQTVLSQVMTIAVGRDWAYYAMSLTIMVVLALAANTSFGGLPVLASRRAFEACATCSLLGTRWYREPAEAGASR